MSGELLQESWVNLFGADPRPWLLAADEPAAAYLALTRLLDRPADDPDVRAARRAMLAAPQTADLLARIPDWETYPVRGHQRPDYAPSLLGLLADGGLAAGDDERVDRALAGMLAHQDDTDRFESLGVPHGSRDPVWGSWPCDHYPITEALVRYGFADDARVRAALERMAADLTETSQGPAWLCLPNTAGGWRGPGRKNDLCPQATIEALRAFGRLDAGRRPAGLEAAELTQAARTVLAVWRDRGTHQPYMFGHGRSFKTVKWPGFWYGALWVLDALRAYPELWDGGADPADRRALAELCACLIAYNAGPDGRVTPRSCNRGFETHSFGQKKRPSPWATAVVCAAIRPYSDLATDIAAVDVLALASSKGGRGSARPPAAQKG